MNALNATNSNGEWTLGGYKTDQKYFFASFLVRLISDYNCTVLLTYMNRKSWRKHLLPSEDIDIKFKNFLNVISRLFIIVQIQFSFHFLLTA